MWMWYLYISGHRADEWKLHERLSDLIPSRGAFLSVMASLVLGALPIASQYLNLSSRVSFSRTEALSVSLSTPINVSASPQSSHHLVYCGRGDKKTAKGKRFNHSYGNARPRNKKKGRGPPRVPIPPSPPKKDRFDDDEVVKIEIDESLF